MTFRTCGKCASYSRALLRCTLGKVNPRTLKGTKEVIQMMGPSAVCGHSKWKGIAVRSLV